MAAYIKPSMASREVEGGIDRYLKYLTDDGAAEYGAVLVESVPSSRIRPGASQDFSARTIFQAQTYRGSRIAESPGIHSLRCEKTNENIYWVQRVEEASSEEVVELTGLVNRISSREAFGENCPALKSTPRGLRQALQISIFPLSSPDARFREMCQQAKATDLYGSYISISTPGTPLPVQTSVARLTTMYFHHRGGPRKWIVIPPKARMAFETRMRLELGDRSSSPCSQFIRHASLWIEPATLRDWGIDFIEITQRAHQVLFIFPGAYYYGYSQGFSIVESKLYAGEGWSYRGYQFCGQSKKCAVDQILVRFEDISSDQGDHDRDVLGNSRGKRKRSLLPRQMVDETAAVSSITVDGGGVDAPPASEEFDISDDDIAEELATGGNSTQNQLQQVITSLRHELAVVQAERDNLRVRKALYKARLLQREEWISSLEHKLDDLGVQLRQKTAMAAESIRGVLRVAERTVAELEAEAGEPSSART